MQEADQRLWEHSTQLVAPLSRLPTMKLPFGLGAVSTSFFLIACVGAAPLPAKAIALNNNAAYNIARGDLDRAQAETKVALEYNPKFIEATYNLGIIEYERGNYVAARIQFLRARILNGDLPWGPFGLGLVSDAADRPKEAEGYYRDALAIDPGFTEARMNLASTLTKQGNLEGAYAELKKCVETSPAVTEVWVMLLQSGTELKRFSDLDDIVKGASLHIPKPEVAVVRALRLLAQDRVNIMSIDEVEHTVRDARTRLSPSWQAAVDVMLEKLSEIRQMKAN